MYSASASALMLAWAARSWCIHSNVVCMKSAIWDRVNDFIFAEPSIRAEETVWGALKSAARKRECVAGVCRLVAPERWFDEPVAALVSPWSSMNAPVLLWLPRASYETVEPKLRARAFFFAACPALWRGLWRMNVSEATCGMMSAELSMVAHSWRMLSQ